jgi:hypothetical protein
VTEQPRGASGDALWRLAERERREDHTVAGNVRNAGRGVVAPQDRIGRLGGGCGRGVGSMLFGGHGRGSCRDEGPVRKCDLWRGHSYHITMIAFVSGQYRDNMAVIVFEDSMADTEEKKFLLRLPAELHQELLRAAEEDMRSLNAEIVILLREAMTERKGQPAVPAR